MEGGQVHVRERLVRCTEFGTRNSFEVLEIQIETFPYQSVFSFFTCLSA
jgi:hypothetical protein